MNLAFVGFRHNHIMGLWDHASHHPTFKTVAACEEDLATRAQLASAGKVNITHTSYADMLRIVDCDAVAIGDYFAKRGALAIAALEAGKHVISDKPLCTDLRELDRIEQLSRERRLRVGCLLDLRDHGVYRAMRRLIRDENRIGEVQTVTFSAQHPLFFGKRAAWYFEPGKHGGVINDIAIHAIDLIPWLTGRRIGDILAAHTWPARRDVAPDFEAGGQLMLRLDNDGGVLGDVSYLSPDALAYSADQYWRVTIHGTAGCLEGRYASPTLTLATSTTPAQPIPADPERTGGVIEDFLADVQGRSTSEMLTTTDVLNASRTTLLAQRAATGGAAISI